MGKITQPSTASTVSEMNHKEKSKLTVKIRVTFFIYKDQVFDPKDA